MFSEFLLRNFSENIFVMERFLIPCIRPAGGLVGETGGLMDAGVVALMAGAKETTAYGKHCLGRVVSSWFSL